MRRKIAYIVCPILIFMAVQAFGQAVVLKTSIQEGSSSFLTVTFQDQNKIDVIPSTVAWWIEDETSGTYVVNQTVAAPGDLASTMTFNISSCAARMVNNARDSENRLFTIEFTYGSTPPTPGPYRGTGHAKYTVYNIPGIVVSANTPCGSTPAPTLTPTPTP